VKNLYKAIYNIQSRLQKIEKTSDNPFYKSKYVPLDKVWDRLQPELNSEGLIVLQFPISIDNTIDVKTSITHVESSETLTEEYTLPLAKQDPQAAGSALTYARRYALMSIFGLCPVDDDAESSMQRSMFSYVKNKINELGNTEKESKIAREGIKEYYNTFTEKEKKEIENIFTKKFKEKQ